MTISTAPSTLSYNGDDSTVNFSITWKYFAKSHVQAVLRSSSGTETTWVLDTDYTLTAAGVDAGGTLTATTPPATGETLIITLEVPNTQTSSLPLGGVFPSTTVENALDQAAQRSAKLAGYFDRALRVPVTDTRSGTQLELPNETTRAGKFFSFDANGDPTVASGTSGDLTAVTAFVDSFFSSSDEGGAMEYLWQKGGDIASADPLILDTDGNYFDVTGTTGISSITVNAGRPFMLQFDGALVLTHSATDLNLPGGENITTAAGDRLIACSTAANKVHVLAYQRANGFPVMLGGKVGSDVASASALAIDVEGSFFDVTGTTSITSMNSKGVGSFVVLQFDGALTLTHHSTDLILTGSQNITTSAGDVGVFYEYASGDWRLVSYSDPAKIRGVGVTLDTEQASTSGTAVTFTGIPSGTKKITVLLEAVSTNGTSSLTIELGDSGGFEQTGYISAVDEGGTVSTDTTAFIIQRTVGAASAYTGVYELYLKDSANFTWVLNGVGGDNSSGNTNTSRGHKSLSAELTQIRVIAQNGTDTFDAGSINIQYQ